MLSSVCIVEVFKLSLICSVELVNLVQGFEILGLKDVVSDLKQVKHMAEVDCSYGHKVVSHEWVCCQQIHRHYFEHHAFSVSYLYLLFKTSDHMPFQLAELSIECVGGVARANASRS